MRAEILAVIIQEGGKLCSELLRLRSHRPKKTGDYQLSIASPTGPQETPIIEASKATSVEAGCVPCAIGHFGTCSGLLSEGMRFARSDGISSTEVIDRVNKCLDELNTMERVDLTEEKISTLPAWEKRIAETALLASRQTRHGLEGINTVEQLETITAQTQTARKEVGRAWFKERLNRMPKEEKAKLAEKAIEKLEEE